jgi:hypothetical protein
MIRFLIIIFQISILIEFQFNISNDLIQRLFLFYIEKYC